MFQGTILRQHLYHQLVLVCPLVPGVLCFQRLLVYHRCPVSLHFLFSQHLRLCLLAPLVQVIRVVLQEYFKYIFAY